MKDSSFSTSEQEGNKPLSTDNNFSSLGKEQNLDIDNNIDLGLTKEEHNTKNDFQGKVSLNNSKTQNLSAHALWGSFIGLLRRENLMTLHTACGEIRDVELKDFVLSVKVYDEYLYKILTKEQNLEKIVFYLRQIDDRINIQFNMVKKSTDYNKENLKKLRDFFGSELEEI